MGFLFWLSTCISVSWYPLIFYYFNNIFCLGESLEKYHIDSRMVNHFSSFLPFQGIWIESLVISIENEFSMPNSIFLLMTLKKSMNPSSSCNALNRRVDSSLITWCGNLIRIRKTLNLKVAYIEISFKTHHYSYGCSTHSVLMTNGL